MSISALAFLAASGLAAGFLAGLVGVGGGLIFAPVLFFYFSHIGVPDVAIAQLTLGSSLFCAFIATMAGARIHYRNDMVEVRTAVTVGVLSSVAVFLVTQLITSRSWYDGTVFQVVFSLVLIAVVLRMVFEREHTDMAEGPVKHPWSYLTLTGTVAGVISAATGVGGGVILLPAYTNLLRMPMKRAVGTSALTIVLISLAGVISYMTVGWDAPTPSWSIGYVDVGHSSILAGTAILSANLGAKVASRVPSKALRYSFAALALIVAVRLLIGAVRGG